MEQNHLFFWVKRTREEAAQLLNLLGWRVILKSNLNAFAVNFSPRMSNQREELPYGLHRNKHCSNWSKYLKNGNEHFHGLNQMDFASFCHPHFRGYLIS